MERSIVPEERLIDLQLTKEMQERFCEANDLYTMCLDSQKRTIGELYGTEEEKAFIKGRVPEELYGELLERLYATEVEDMIEEPLAEENIRLCGAVIRMGGKPIAVWIVFAVLSDIGEIPEDMPKTMGTTSADHFYKSMRFLTTLSRQYFAAKIDEAFAQEASVKSIEEKERAEAELKRNEAMSAIVQEIVSEREFTETAKSILREVCEFLQIGNACLLKVSPDQGTADMICEWTAQGLPSHQDLVQKIPVAKIPFLTDKPFVISSDTPLPSRFVEVFEKMGAKAAMTIPIEVHAETGMYLCFYETEKERIWESADIKFIHDAKQVLQSILARRVASNSLASSYMSLDAILENVGCGICVKDPITRKILYTNQQFHEMFKSEKDVAEFELLLEEQYTGRPQGKSMEVYSDLENSYYDICYTQIHWVNGRSVMLCTIYDVTDKKIYQQKIERQANNDFLTGLYNRMRCEQDLTEYIKRTKDAGGQGALLYIDLDDFKHINDGLGHQYGDVLLKAISHSLQHVSGIETTCYRMGGDEFIIIVSHYHFSMLNRILGDIQAIFTKPWFLKGADYYCSMSMGVVRFPKDGDTVQELIKKADIALYEAKKSGKNRVEYYDDHVESTSFKRLELEKNMHDAALDSCKEFEVYYQPVVDISKPGDPCSGAEALIRWNSQKMGFVSPSEFIPLAEYLGLFNPIGDFILEEACKRCKYWNDMGHPEYRINVNLSVVQLLQNDMVDRIRRVLKETKLKPTNLTLEVTESLAINDMARMKRVLAQIKQLGVWVALDDFGTGYSSLNHIRELPIDVIKIDRCFVVDIGKDDYSEVFVKMVSELADTIGVRMCVEGVEKDEQLDKLRQMKVQYIQGFYFNRPMRAIDFEEKYL